VTNKKIISSILSERSLKMIYYTEGCTTQIENWSAELPYSFLFSSTKGKCLSYSLAFPKTQYKQLDDYCI